MSDEPRISVVVPTLGSHETLRRVLVGLAGQTVDAQFELIVVADKAEEDPDALRRLADEQPYPARMKQATRAGASANRNLGAHESRAPLILFIDNDTIPRPDLLAHHLAWQAEHPETEIGVLGLVEWSSEVRVTTFMRWLDTGLQFDYANMSAGDVGWGRFYTCNVSLKREFFERAGGFDEVNFPYGYEDTDWAYRASKLGFKLLYNPDAVVDHLRTMTLDFWKRRIRRVAASEYRYTQLHPETCPWFHGIFTAAAKRSPGRRRSLRLAPFVPRGTPWLGPRVWKSVDLAYKQDLAPHFLDAWDAAATESTDRGSGPNLAEWE